MNQNQIVEIIKKQRAFFSSGITLAVNYRITALKKLYAAVQQNEEAIAHALRADLGKSPEEGYMCETGIVLSEISYMHTISAALPKSRLWQPLWPSLHPGVIKSPRLTV